MKEDFLDTFRQSSVGVNFGEEICMDIFSLGVERHLLAEAVLFQENEPVQGIYLVLTGMLKLVRYSPDGREVVIHFAEPYQLFAEAALFLGHYPVAAVATEPTSVLLIRKDDVFTLMDQHSMFMRCIFDAMAIWLKRMVDKINQLTLNDATARVSSYLLREISYPSPARQEAGMLQLPVKKGELARLLNMNQATLSRALRKLQDENVIRVQARTFQILSEQELKRYSLPPLH